GVTCRRAEIAPKPRGTAANSPKIGWSSAVRNDESRRHARSATPAPIECSLLHAHGLRPATFDVAHLGCVVDQFLLQNVPPAEESRLHGSLRDAEYFRDFRVAQSVHIAEHDGRSILLG